MSTEREIRKLLADAAAGFSFAHGTEDRDLRAREAMAAWLGVRVEDVRVEEIDGHLHFEIRLPPDPGAVEINVVKVKH